MARLVILSDIHLYSLAVPPWRLLGKRLLGQLNLYLRRRRVFDHSLLPGALRRVADLKPDQVLIPGDLTTTALPSEFRLARKLLDPLLGRIPCLILPGNHDRYTHASARQREMEKLFAPWMPPSYPHTLSLTAGWSLLALDSCVPRCLTSRGEVSSDQIDHARTLLAADPAHATLVLCHYPILTPPAMPQRWEHGLTGADSLRQLLTERLQHSPTPLLYLHGHIHHPWCHPVIGQNLDNLIDLSAGSLCHRGHGFRLGQGFWELHLPDTSSAPTLIRHHRQVSHDHDGWITTDHHKPTPAAMLPVD
ncbi:MAG: metallophosphoesterase [Phycisphaeraceae bacterium]|nr:metallophosphoesterase [Phycisphaeraceae bacterium]